MHSRVRQLLPVILLAVIMLLAALSTAAVLTANAPAQDADAAFRESLIIMRIKVQEFIANSWVNENPQSQHAISFPLVLPLPGINAEFPTIAVDPFDN